MIFLLWKLQLINIIITAKTGLFRIITIIQFYMMIKNPHINHLLKHKSQSLWDAAVNNTLHEIHP